MEIVGLGKACELATQQLSSISSHLSKTRDLLLTTLLHKTSSSSPNPLKIRINADPRECDILPNTLSVSFYGLKATELVWKMENQVGLSAGAACHSEGITVSHVLTAMGVPVEYAVGTLR